MFLADSPWGCKGVGRQVYDLSTVERNWRSIWKIIYAKACWVGISVVGKNCNKRKIYGKKNF